MNTSNCPEATVRKIVSLYSRTFLLLLTMLVLTAGCAWPWVFFTGKGPQHPDPLEEWKLCWSQDSNKLNKAIVDDYQDYIQKLPAEEKKFIGPIQFFEDGTGQHAVRIEIALKGIDWAHVLIYDKENKRMRVIKYAAGRYMS
jgi:hypothetical protein